MPVDLTGFIMFMGGRLNVECSTGDGDILAILEYGVSSSHQHQGTHIDLERT